MPHDPIERKILEQETRKPKRVSLWSRIAKLFRPPRQRVRTLVKKRGKR